MATRAKTAKKTTAKKAVKKVTPKKTVKSVNSSKNTKKLNKKGLGNHALIVIAAVVTLVGAAGFLVWQRQNNNDMSADAAVVQGCVSLSFAQIQSGSSSGKGGQSTSSTASKNSSSYPTCVKYMQYLLSDNGFTTPADGIFGKETHKWVLSFQSTNKLTRNGVVDRKNWETLCWRFKGQWYAKSAGCNTFDPRFIDGK